MARAQWPLQQGRPTLEVILTHAKSGQKVVRTLLADTGAGAEHDQFEFVLDGVDCVLCGGLPFRTVAVGGAYSGVYPAFSLPIEIPALGFSDLVFAVGISPPPLDFDGIACFRFLNRFTYGNFGNKGEFALEA